MEVKWIKLSKIRPYFRNPRKHNIEKLVESIKKFGFISPIIVDEKNEILVGHGRYFAVSQLQGKLDNHIKTIDNKKLKKNLEMVNKGYVKVIKILGLSEKQKKEYRIVDNRVVELSEWDYQKLAFELIELDKKAIGFTEKEIENIVKSQFIEEKKKRKVIEEEIIEKVKEEIEKKFEIKSHEEEKNKIPIICPKCLYEFYLDEKELKRRLL